MKNKTQQTTGWLDNFNDSKVSLPPGFVGEGTFNGPQWKSPAWGGQFQDGGLIPMAQKGEKIKYVESKNDPRYKAYQDSLSLYKTSLKNMWAEKNKSKSKVTKKGFIPFDKFDTFVLGSNLEYNDENRYPGENFEAHKKKSTVVSKRKLNSLIKNNIKPIGFDINEWKSGINSKPVLNYSTVYKKPQQQVIVNPLQPKVEAINLPPMQNQDPSFLKQELDLIRPIQAPKSYNVNMQRYNMQGPSDYYNYNQEGVDYETAMRVQRATEAYNKYIEEKYGNEEALKNPKAAERLKQLRQDVQLTPQYQMGGSIPGAVGFTYARTKGIPSEGPCAKKTMASAQEGRTITIDEGDGKKRKILTDSSEYAKLYNEGRIGVQNDDDESISFNPLNEVVVTPYDKQYPFYQELSDEEKKYFNSDSPIGRQLRSRAQDNVGFNADKATDFAMGWLRDLPLASLQAPQSALVEGVEALRGNDFNMLSAL
jgi:hypothetical protein